MLKVGVGPLGAMFWIFCPQVHSGTYLFVSESYVFDDAPKEIHVSGVRYSYSEAPYSLNNLSLGGRASARCCGYCLLTGASLVLLRHCSVRALVLCIRERIPYTGRRTNKNGVEER